MAARRKKPGTNADIAGEDEILKCLTSVLRGTDAEEKQITLRDKLRAAELLAKRYGTLGAAVPQAEGPRIIDDIPNQPDKDE